MSEEEPRESYSEDWPLITKINWICSITRQELEREVELGTDGKFSLTPEIFSEIIPLVERLDPFKISNLHRKLIEDLGFPREIAGLNANHSPPNILLERNSEARVAITAWINVIGNLATQAIMGSFDNKTAHPFDVETSRQLEQCYILLFKAISLFGDFITKGVKLTDLPENFRSQLTQEIKNEREEIRNEQNQARSDLVLLKAEFEKSVNDSEDRKEKLEAVLAVASEELGKRGIASEATHFFEESKAHQKNAQVWLGASLAATIATLVHSYNFVKSYSPALFCKIDCSAVDWNIFIPRFSLMGILLLFTLVIIGNYRAERHNAIVNKHRSNALNTFETMTQSTTTQDVRDAVTLTAASAIYAPQDTGFSRRTTPQQMSAADILGNMVNRSSD